MMTWCLISTSVSPGGILDSRSRSPGWVWALYTSTGGQCWSKLFKLFKYSNSKDRIVVFDIRIRSIFKTRIYSVFSIRSKFSIDTANIRSLFELFEQYGPNSTIRYSYSVHSQNPNIFGIRYSVQIYYSAQHWSEPQYQETGNLYPGASGNQSSNYYHGF